MIFDHGSAVRCSEAPSSKIQSGSRTFFRNVRRKASLCNDLADLISLQRRDIYCDTRLILQKLEERFPNGALGASQPDHKAIEQLLASWTIDGGIFVRVGQAIPPELPLLNDPKFIKDREDYSGRSWSQGNIKAMRPEALSHIREAFEFLENGFLADGREWILKTEKPALADIEGQSFSTLESRQLYQH